MIIAAHQPLYLPWLGYLDRMAKADLFVVIDDAPFEAQGFANRNRVKLASGAGWLTVPLEKSARRERIFEKRISNRAAGKDGWRRRTWATIESSYRRAPYFGRYANELHDLYARTWTSLVDLDLHLIGLARRWLGITVPMVRSSLLGLQGAGTDRLIDMCRKLKARAYLSGTGMQARSLDVERMGRAGIGVVWQHFDHPVYPQRHGGFLPQLAFIDLVMNCGDSSREVLFDRAHPFHANAA